MSLSHIFHAIPLALFAGLASRSAHAHVGHAGELAGHSHWIGLGALGVAVAIGAAIALWPKKADNETAEQDGEDAAQKDGEEASA